MVISTQILYTHANSFQNLVEEDEDISLKFLSLNFRTQSLSIEAYTLSENYNLSKMKS